MRSARIFTGLVIIVVIGLLCAAVAVWLLRPAPTPPTPAPEWVNDYNLTPTEPETIASGTVVDRSAPAGWSHLIIKSQPRVKPSEIPHVPTPFGLGRDLIVKQVAWLFTAFTADVVKEEQDTHNHYRIRAIGLGLGCTISGHETVITVGTAEQFGQKLSFAERKTLEKSYETQKQARVVVHGPLFALVDTPVTFYREGKNRMVRFRYAILVNAQSGQLETLCWRAGSEDGQCADLSQAVLLNANTIDEAEMIPDVSQFVPPNKLSFGVDCLPPHRSEVAIPTELQSIAGQSRFTADEARILEDGLRKLLPKQQ